MKLVVLPNGDAVRPDVVRSVEYLEPIEEKYVGDIKLAGHAPRVAVRTEGGGCILIRCHAPIYAVKTRDTIIKDVNDALAEASA